MTNLKNYDIVIIENEKLKLFKINKKKEVNNMFDKDYILSELRNGREYEDIMKDITDALNEASKAFEQEQSEEEEKRYKIDGMQEIVDLVHDYFIEYYGGTKEDINEIDKAFKDVKAEEMVELFDNCLKLANSLADLDQIFNLGKKTKVKKNLDSKGEIEVNVEIEPDKILSDFLKFLK